MRLPFVNGEIRARGVFLRNSCRYGAYNICEVGKIMRRKPAVNLPNYYAVGKDMEFMVHACDLRQKEVVNIYTAERLGYITDVEIDFETGSVRSVVVPKRRTARELLSKRKRYIIPWEDIVCVGGELVLVKLREFMNASQSDGDNGKTGEASGQNRILE